VITLQVTSMELAAVGVLLRATLETHGVDGLPADMVTNLMSFSAKVIQSIESDIGIYGNGEGK
jgi:hypothetical protein